VIAVIGGQGHVLGRGSQQFSPRVIRAAGVKNIVIVATQASCSLSRAPLCGWTPATKSWTPQLAGWTKVITGYGQRTMHCIA